MAFLTGCLFKVSPEFMIKPLVICPPHRAEKVAEITSWLKSHPVSCSSRASCDLQVLDGALVEKIEEAVDRSKVTIIFSLKLLHISSNMIPSFSLCPQVKKSSKKVRVTVKPHLLFRVCTCKLVV